MSVISLRKETGAAPRTSSGEGRTLCPLPSFPTNGREGAEPFSYYFMTDEAFPLKVSVMTPYLRIMLTNNIVLFITVSLVSAINVERVFVTLNDLFELFEGPVCCKQETVNSIVKSSVVLHNFIRIWEGLLYETGERSAVNQSDTRILNQKDGRWQRLSRTQLLKTRLADYFSTSVTLCQLHTKLIMQHVD
jgi:hypothetical protein